MERLPEDSSEELLRREQYLFPLIQVTSMVVVIQVRLEDCAKALLEKYGLEWKEEWGEVLNSLKHIQLKLDAFHAHIMNQEEN